MATIREVAQASGVSSATVSFVLRGDTKRVSKATRERVLQAVRDLGYRPPAFVEGQKVVNTETLAILLPPLKGGTLGGMPYVRELISELTLASLNHGWNVTILADRVHDSETEIRRQIDGKCDGIVMVSPAFAPDTTRRLIERGSSVVATGSCDRDDIARFDVDNSAVGRFAARHLIQLGHRRLGFMSLAGRGVASKDREAAFCDTVSEVEPLARVTVFHSRIPEEMLDRFLAMPEAERPTALFTWNDWLAMWMIDALEREGLTVPRDVSIVGVDGIRFSYERRLCTSRQPLGEIAQAAVDHLISGASHEPIHQFFDPDWQVGNTTGPPRG